MPIIIIGGKRSHISKELFQEIKKTAKVKTMVGVPGIDFMSVATISEEPSHIDKAEKVLADMQAMQDNGKKIERNSMPRKAKHGNYNTKIPKYKR